MPLHIRHLHIEDFRAFRGTHEISFGEDPERHLELISGPNASGKSTIVEALQLCFYGETDGDRLHSYVNQQVIDELSVDEQATARISIDLFDTGTEENIRITREVSTFKTPQGRTDVIEEPLVKKQKEDTEWTNVSNPKKYLKKRIPTQTRSFSFYDPEQILGLDTWEEGESFEELVNRMRELRNIAAHAGELPESSDIGVSGEYLTVLNRNLAMIDDSVEVDRAEEYLVIESRKQDGPLVSKGTQVLISFALLLAAGELDGIETPLVMDMPFTRVDSEAFRTMRQLLRENSVRQTKQQPGLARQTIIVGFPDRVDQVADDLSEFVGSHHRLTAEDMGRVSIKQIE